MNTREHAEHDEPPGGAAAAKQVRPDPCESPLSLLPPVDRSSPIPAWLQAEAILSDAISKGLFPLGCRLPSTPRLSKQLRVSVMTGHRALQRLAEEGWIARGRGRCSVVRPNFRRAVASKPRFRICVSFRGGNERDGARRWEFLAGFEAAANETGPTTERMIQQYQSAGELDGTRADGFVCLQPDRRDLEVLREIAKTRPVVLAGRAGPECCLPAIVSGEQDGVRSAARHLIELGHRRMVFMIDPGQANVHERYTTCVSELRWSDPAIVAGQIACVSAGVPEVQLRRRLLDMMNREDAPTAILAGDLSLALRLLNSLPAVGLQIPGDLSVIGFDDTGISGTLAPNLTVVGQASREMGRRGYARILRLLEGRGRQAGTERVPQSLLIGTTTGRPLSRNMHTSTRVVLAS